MGKRDELWDKTWNTFYDVSYYVILFGIISKRWQKFDFYTRLLVAITASSSAVAGWALWNDANFKIFWVLLAGFASFISIVHTVASTQEKVTHYTKLNNSMNLLQIEYESFLNEMEIYPEFVVDDFFKKHQSLREEYKKILSSNVSDFLTTEKLKNEAQTILNKKLGIKE